MCQVAAGLRDTASAQMAGRDIGSLLAEWVAGEGQVASHRHALTHLAFPTSCLLRSCFVALSVLGARRRFAAAMNGRMHAAPLPRQEPCH
jgi:hypothetical protein